MLLTVFLRGEGVLANFLAWSSPFSLYQCSSFWAPPRHQAQSLRRGLWKWVPNCKSSAATHPSSPLGQSRPHVPVPRAFVPMGSSRTILAFAESGVSWGRMSWRRCRTHFGTWKASAVWPPEATLRDMLRTRNMQTPRQGRQSARNSMTQRRMTQRRTLFWFSVRFCLLVFKIFQHCHH